MDKIIINKKIEPVEVDVTNGAEFDKVYHKKFIKHFFLKAQYVYIYFSIGIILIGHILDLLKRCGRR